MKKFKNIITESMSNDEFMDKLESSFKKYFPNGWANIRRVSIIGSPIIKFEFGLVDRNELTSKILMNDPAYHLFLIDGEPDGYEAKLSIGSISVNTDKQHLVMDSIKSPWRKSKGDATKLLKTYNTFFTRLKKLVKDNENEIYDRKKYSDKYFK